MKKFNTDNLELAIAVRNNGTNKEIMVAMTDDNSPMDEPQYTVVVPAELCKRTVNNDSLTKHIIGFFIKG